MQPTLQKQYTETVVPALMKEFGLKNKMQTPKLLKVTINVGYGRHVKETAFVENIERTLTLISGQKPVHHAAKKSISNFKIREGQNIGVSVTLRGKQMYEFMYKLIHLTLPRIRDFRGLSKKGFDRQGNYSFGLKESIAFPEVKAESLDKIHGLQVVITTSAKNKEEGTFLLKQLGFPFTDK